MKTFKITVFRMVKQTAEITVQANDKRSAMLGADVGSAEWVTGETSPVRVVEVYVAVPVLEVPGVPTEDKPYEPPAIVKRGARSV